MAISQYGNEYYGLSGDDKPLGTPLNGRKFTEMDTSKEYRFDAENQQWLQQSQIGGSSTLSGLTDVDISNPTDGQTLVYNAESGKWENGAGGVLVLHEIPVEANDSNTKATPVPMVRLDKTWQEIYDAGVCFVESILSQGDIVYKALMPVFGIMTPIPDEGINVYTVEAYDAAGPSIYTYGVNEGGANGYPERAADN